MYEVEITAIEALRIRFERQMAAREPEARTTAMEYIAALATFVDAFNDGPGADARRMGADTTGALDRIEERVVWAEAERHRVRRALNAVA